MTDVDWFGWLKFVVYFLGSIFAAWYGWVV